MYGPCENRTNKTWHMKLVQHPLIRTITFASLFTLSSIGCTDGQETVQQQSEFAGEFVSIPQGSYTMGSDAGQENERPIHKVTIQPFKMAVHPVTKKEYGRFVEATGYVGERGCVVFTTQLEELASATWATPTIEQTDDHPVVCVSWDDTQAYIKWLNQQTGQQYRLPTEAEWEFAARAGTETEFSTGDTIDCTQARYGFITGECGQKFSTDPVGAFEANAYGLFDMHGNVWEWVQDCANENYIGAPDNGDAWTQGDCSKRVLRGGSWGAQAEYMRSAFRFWSQANERNWVYGFRLAQDI